MIDLVNGSYAWFDALLNSLDFCIFVFLQETKNYEQHKSYQHKMVGQHGL